MTDYHHTVIDNATPFGEFTKWLPPSDNFGMDKRNLLDLRDRRRTNLRRFMEREGLSQSDIARKYAAYRSQHEPDAKPVKPSFFNDILRSDKKSFGEKLAHSLENALGLKPGQLSMEKSPLEMERPSLDPDTQVLEYLQNMTPRQRAKLLQKVAGRRQA